MSTYIILTELIHQQDELEWHGLSCLPLNPTVSLDNLCKIYPDRIIVCGHLHVICLVL